MQSFEGTVFIESLQAQLHDAQDQANEAQDSQMAEATRS